MENNSIKCWWNNLALAQRSHASPALNPHPSSSRDALVWQADLPYLRLDILIQKLLLPTDCSWDFLGMLFLLPIELLSLGRRFQNPSARGAIPATRNVSCTEANIRAWSVINSNEFLVT